MPQRTTAVRVSGFFLLAAALLAIPTATRAQELNGEIERLIAQGKVGASRVGVSIIDCASGNAIASIHSDAQFIPASNMKLLTSGAALRVLGKDFQFRTELVRDGDRLIVRGCGDPALADPAVLDRSEPKLTVDDVLGALTGAVKKSGMTAVREIVIDDRIFDREYVHPSWPKNNLHRGYSAEVCGLNFHTNVILAFTSPNPQGAGTLPIIRLQPDAPWLPMTVKARTSAQLKNTTWLSREPEANAFTLFGEVGVASQVGAEITVHNSAEFFGMVLADRLGRAGVKVAAQPQGSTPAVRMVGEHEELPAGTAIGVIATPIAEALHRCNSDSENLYAESFLKRIGHEVTHEPGSWANGATVLRMTLGEKLGASAVAATTIADGSGLSRDDAVSPATLARWLATFSNDPLGETFFSSLAAPGQKGTLRERFVGMRLKNSLRGKSGYITSVRSLSGVLTNAETGRQVVFSILINDVPVGQAEQAAKTLHEAIVKVADDWLARRAADGPKRGG